MSDLEVRIDLFLFQFHLKKSSTATQKPHIYFLNYSICSLQLEFIYHFYLHLFYIHETWNRDMDTWKNYVIQSLPINIHWLTILKLYNLTTLVRPLWIEVIQLLNSHYLLTQSIHSKCSHNFTYSLRKRMRTSTWAQPFL